MSTSLAEFNQLVNAEEYLEFFALPYDPQFVNVNRLHILKKFSSLIDSIDSESPELDESEKLTRYHAALQKAYNTFTASSPLNEKLFKVFNEKPQNVVLLSQIGEE
jgi:nitrogenase-stabilizing/protective protein